jgi:hypothetical protein
MTERILLVDYSKERLDQLSGRIRNRLANTEVIPLLTDPYDPNKGTNIGPLEQIRANRCDILIGHIGGNPSGYECLKTFKEYNPKGKVILYTKQETIPLDKFEGLKLANAICKRAVDDSKVFANDDEMLNVVNRVRQEAGVVYWKSPFKDKAVLGTLLSLVTGFIGLAAALIKLLHGG